MTFAVILKKNFMHAIPSWQTVVKQQYKSFTTRWKQKVKKNATHWKIKSSNSYLTFSCFFIALIVCDISLFLMYRVPHLLFVGFIILHFFLCCFFFPAVERQQHRTKTFVSSTFQKMQVHSRDCFLYYLQLRFLSLKG